MFSPQNQSMASLVVLSSKPSEDGLVVSFSKPSAGGFAGLSSKLRWRSRGDFGRYMTASRGLCQGKSSSVVAVDEKKHSDGFTLEGIWVEYFM